MPKINARLPANTKISQAFYARAQVRAEFADFFPEIKFLDALASIRVPHKFRADYAPFHLQETWSGRSLDPVLTLGVKNRCDYVLTRSPDTPDLFLQIRQEPVTSRAQRLCRRFFVAAAYDWIIEEMRLSPVGAHPHDVMMTICEHMIECGYDTHNGTRIPGWDKAVAAYRKERILPTPEKIKADISRQQPVGSLQSRRELI